MLLMADDSVLMATMDAACADWLVEVPLGQPRIEIALTLGDGETAGTSTEGLSAAIRAVGSRLTISGGGIEGWADAVTGRAACIVPRRYLGRPAALAEEVLDPLMLFLLTRTGGRTPLHAAGVMIGDTAWALAGRSGAGKSTLALCAAGRGLPVLSDDSVYVQMAPRLRIWGFDRPIHILPDEAPPGDHAMRLRGGRHKAALDLPRGVAGVRHADRAQLVLLARGPRPALERVTPDLAIAQLARLDEGFDLLAQASAQAVVALAAQGAWRLTLSDDPQAALDLLVAQAAAG
jgi:hypothetical protein